MTSSTSSSERIPLWKSRSVRIIVAAVALVVLADRAMSTVVDDPIPTTYPERLSVQPTEDGIYLLGNSMFKTGIEPSLLQALIGPTPVVDFEYHNGHYTNLWYLIAKTALGETATTPRVVVWGFRPAYALLPAFRQNRENDTDLFAFDDPLYNSLSQGIAGDGVAEEPAKGLSSLLQDHSALYQARDRAQAKLSDQSVRIGLAVIDALGLGEADTLRKAIVDGDRTLADEITRLVTHGEVNLTEELVIDTAGQFITGPQVAFDEGFIPATASTLQQKGLDQVVIIWRPVNVAEGNPDPIEDAFVADALAWFGDHDIPVLDLYHDDRIRLEHFASGDHYNEAGRTLITHILADFLVANGFADE